VAAIQLYLYYTPVEDNESLIELIFKLYRLQATASAFKVFRVWMSWFGFAHTKLHAANTCSVNRLTFRHCYCGCHCSQQLQHWKECALVKHRPTHQCTTVRLFVLNAGRSLSHYWVGIKNSARLQKLATAIPSVRLSVCLSVRPSLRHTPVLCQNDGT